MSAVVRLYRPSNGTEGIDFQSAWCARCKRDALWNGTAENPDYVDNDKLCPLIANAMAFKIDEPGYPQEWVYDQDGIPKCLAFEPTGKPDRCTITTDMFTGQSG